MLLRLCGPPSIPLSFNLATVLPRWITYRFRLDAYSVSQTSSYQRLWHGLPGYIVLFDPHAFVPQRQLQFCELPSQSVSYDISKHFTATCHIPPTSSVLKVSSIKGSSTVKLWDFTSDLLIRLRTL